MSKLHQALQNAGALNHQQAGDQFNPLSMDLKKTTPQKNRNRLYWAIGVLCLLAMPIVLWLTQPSQNDVTQASPGAGLQDEPEPAIAAVSSPVTEREQPQRDTATASEPATDSSTAPASPTAETTHSVTQRLGTVEANPPTPAVEPAAASSTPGRAPNNQSVSPSISPQTTIQEPVPVVNDSPDNTLITTSRGLWLPKVEQAINQGELEVAEALLKQWLASTTDDETPRIWLARLYLNNGFYLAAEPLLTHLDSVDALALQGLIYEKTGRFAEAAQRFERLFRTDPSNAQWLLLWAINAENNNEPKIAITLYQTFINQFRFENDNWLQFAQQRLLVLGGS